jgi:hypothetical protein
MRTWGVVLLGYGRMGKAAHSALREITGQFAGEGVQIRVLAILDSDRRLIQSLKSAEGPKAVLVPENGFTPIPVSVILRREVGLGPQDEFLVYDATCSATHFGHLEDICEHFPRAIYVGEKPIFTDAEQLPALDHFPGRIFCNLVESQNEVTLKLAEMQRNGLRFRRLRFWRINSVALLKVFAGQKRVGITEGALLDKSIHDLALTSLLLHGQGVWHCEPVVQEAVNLAYMPPAAEPSTAFSEYRTEGATDVAGFARLHWSAPAPVTAEFNYGWVGVKRFDDLCARVPRPRLRGLLSSFGLEERKWLSRTVVDGGENGSFEQQEARILVAEGVETGKPVRLVVNFLKRPEIRPFVFDTGAQEFQPLAQHEHGNNSLARVFENLIRGCLHKERLSAAYGADIIQEIHSACFAIRERALSVSAAPHDVNQSRELCSPVLVR